MANFQTAPKLRIVNSADQFKVIKLSKTASGAYEAAAGADAAAILADTDLYKVEGFAELVSGNVLETVKTLGIFGQKQVSTLTLTTPGIVVGEELSIEMIVKTFNLESEFVRFDGRNQKSRFYQLIVRTGDTVTTIAARIAAMINADGERDGYVYATATSAAGVVTITAESEGWEISFKFTGSSVTSGSIVTAFAVTAPAFEGRNVYRQMNVKRLENPNRTYAYAAGHYGAANEVPVKGAKYSSLIIKFKVDRADLSGPEVANSGPVSGEYGVEIYFNESDAALTALRDEIVAWSKVHVPKTVEYNATTVAAAIAAETPVVTTV